MCDARSAAVANAKPHFWYGHIRRKFSTPGCVSQCRFSLDESRKPMVHPSNAHVYGRSASCVLACFNRKRFSAKLLPHVSHVSQPTDDDVAVGRQSVG